MRKGLEQDKSVSVLCMRVCVVVHDGAERGGEGNEGRRRVADDGRSLLSSSQKGYGTIATFDKS